MLFSRLSHFAMRPSWTSLQCVVLFLTGHLACSRQPGWQEWSKAGWSTPTRRHFPSLHRHTQSGDFIPGEKWLKALSTCVLHLLVKRSLVEAWRGGMWHRRLCSHARGCTPAPPLPELFCKSCSNRFKIRRNYYKDVITAINCITRMKETRRQACSPGKWAPEEQRGTTTLDHTLEAKDISVSPILMFKLNKRIQK